VKVGDLVELSAYGKKLTCNFSTRGCVGLVVDIDAPASGPTGIHPGTAITVQWTGHTDPMSQIRRDIKYAK
jgi:hypothetical protein